jgi:hypothetical protein
VRICESFARTLSNNIGVLVIFFFLANAFFGIVANHFEKWEWPWWCILLAAMPLVIIFLLLLILRLSFGSNFNQKNQFHFLFVFNNYYYYGSFFLGIYLLFRPRNFPSTFACPGVPFIPCLGVFVNFYMMMGLPFTALEYTAVWCGLGLLIYFAYGIRNSKLNYQVKIIQSTPSINHTN